MCGETVLPSHRHKRLYPPDLGSIYEEPLSFCCWSPPGIVTWSCWTRPFWKVLWKAIRFQPGEVCPGFKREVLLKFSLLFFLCVAFFFLWFRTSRHFFPSLPEIASKTQRKGQKVEHFPVADMEKKAHGFIWASLKLIQGTWIYIIVIHTSSIHPL